MRFTRASKLTLFSFNFFFLFYVTFSLVRLSWAFISLMHVPKHVLYSIIWLWSEMQKNSDKYASVRSSYRDFRLSTIQSIQCRKKHSLTYFGSKRRCGMFFVIFTLRRDHTVKRTFVIHNSQCVHNILSQLNSFLWIVQHFGVLCVDKKTVCGERSAYICEILFISILKHRKQRLRFVSFLGKMMIAHFFPS